MRCRKTHWPCSGKHLTRFRPVAWRESSPTAWDNSFRIHFLAGVASAATPAAWGKAPFPVVPQPGPWDSAYPS